MDTLFVLDKIMASKLSLSYVLGECKELLDEVIKRDWEEAKKEWEDVCGTFLVWLTGVLGIGFKLRKGFGLGAAERWKQRLDVWERIFELHEVTFDKSYLNKGGNYRKKKKVQFALDNVNTQMDESLLSFIDFE